MIALERDAASSGEQDPPPDRDSAETWKWLVALLAAELERMPQPDRHALIATLLDTEGTSTQRKLARDIAAGAGITSLDPYLPMMFPEAD